MTLNGADRTRRKYHELETQLIEILPEAQSEYREFIRDWGDDPMLHVLFGDLLCSRWGHLFGPPEDEIRLRRVFELVEQMATHPDDAVQNVVAVTICEYLSGWNYLARAWKYMGEWTKPIAHRMAVAWGHPLPEEYELLTEEQRLRYRERWEEERRKLGRPLEHGEPERITARLFREFGIRPYYPLGDKPPA